LPAEALQIHFVYPKSKPPPTSHEVGGGKPIDLKPGAYLP